MLERPRSEDPYAKLPKLPSFTLSSSDVTDGEQMPITYAFTDAGAGAENLSPQLSWSGFPENTQSFVVSCYDPDAPTPSGFWHWIVVDIPASVTSLERGAGAGNLPAGAFAIQSDWGMTNYGGPLPPEGDPVGPHRYYFAVHAVTEPTLGVDASASPAFVAFNLIFKASARALLVPTFAR
jgi:Raf kinase inhibitor-like YbhB/YbcL family protein